MRSETNARRLHQAIFMPNRSEAFNKLNITSENMGPHVMRATAATHALDNGADIVKVQE